MLIGRELWSIRVQTMEMTWWCNLSFSFLCTQFSRKRQCKNRNGCQKRSMLYTIFIWWPDHTFCGFTGVITHAGCWENTRKACKSRAEGEWFTSFSSVLPTSQVGYHAGKPIESVVYCFYKITFTSKHEFLHSLHDNLWKLFFRKSQHIFMRRYIEVCLLQK